MMDWREEEAKCHRINQEPCGFYFFLMTFCSFRTGLYRLPRAWALFPLHNTQHLFCHFAIQRLDGRMIYHGVLFLTYVYARLSSPRRRGGIALLLFRGFRNAPGSRCRCPKAKPILRRTEEMGRHAVCRDNNFAFCRPKFALTKSLGGC